MKKGREKSGEFSKRKTSRRVDVVSAEKVAARWNSFRCRLPGLR